MARQKENPGGSELIWIALLGVGAYLAYEYFLVPNAVASTTNAVLNPQATGTPVSSAPTPTSTYTPPAVYSYNPAGAAATNLPTNAAPYIVATAGAAPPAGYSTVNTTDNGVVFLRDDLYAKAFAANIQVASPLANITMAGLKSAAGISGLFNMGWN